ncbi:MAG: protein jag [Patescibacteria group bacterium]
MKNEKISKLDANALKITKDLTEKLIKLLGIEAKIEVEEDKENEAIKVQVETKDSGILIGYHGETISSLQLILGIMVSKKIGEWVRVIVNIGDYWERREETLRRMALTAAQRAKFSSEPVVLPPLSSGERRIIHLVLAGHPDVISESEGEGKDRRLVVKPRKTG